MELSLLPTNLLKCPTGGAAGSEVGQGAVLGTLGACWEPHSTDRGLLCPISLQGGRQREPSHVRAQPQPASCPGRPLPSSAGEALCLLNFPVGGSQSWWEGRESAGGI